MTREQIAQEVWGSVAVMIPHLSEVPWEEITRRPRHAGTYGMLLHAADRILALHQQHPAPPSVTADERDALQKLETICDEIFGRWDKDQRPGKLLTALAGRLPRYRQDVDEVRAALTAHEGGNKNEWHPIEAARDWLMQNCQDEGTWFDSDAMNACKAIDLLLARKPLDPRLSIVADNRGEKP